MSKRVSKYTTLQVTLEVDGVTKDGVKKRAYGYGVHDESALPKTKKEALAIAHDFKVITKATVRIVRNKITETVEERKIV